MMASMQNYCGLLKKTDVEHASKYSKLYFRCEHEDRVIVLLKSMLPYKKTKCTVECTVYYVAGNTSTY